MILSQNYYVYNICLCIQFLEKKYISIHNSMCFWEEEIRYEEFELPLHLHVPKSRNRSNSLYSRFHQKGSVWRIFVDKHSATFINLEWYTKGIPKCIFIIFEYNDPISYENRHINTLQCISFRIKGTYESYWFDSVDVFLEYIMQYTSFLVRLLTKHMSINDVFINENRDKNGKDDIQWAIQEFNHLISEPLRSKINSLTV